MSNNENNALVPIDEDIREEFYKDNTEEEDAAVNDEYYPLPTDRTARTHLWSVISLVLAIAALPFCYFLPWCGAIIAALAVGAALFSRLRLGFFTGLSVFSMILGIIGTVSGVLFTVADVFGLI